MYTSQAFSKVRFSALYSFMLLCFLLGAPLQITGVLTLTETNYLAISLLVVCFTFRKKVYLDRSTMAMIVLFLYVTFICIFYKSPASYLLVYCYYLLCPVLVFKAGKILSQKITLSPKAIITYCNYFLLVQMLFAIVQVIAGEQIASFSKIPIFAIDAVSGTFFIKSDASLSMFALLVVLTAFSLGVSAKLKFLSAFISIAIIFLTNSKAIQGLAIVMIPSVLFYSGFLQGRFAVGKRVLVFIVLMIALALLMPMILDMYNEMLDVFRDAYYSRYKSEAAGRLAPVGEAIYADFYWIGKGLLTYYNPLSKNWDYYSGFSLVYEFYLDCGFIGLCLITYFFMAFTIENIKDNFYRVAYFGSIVCFSTFNLVLTDLPFLFALSFFYFIHKKESIIHEKIIHPRYSRHPR